MLSAVNIADNRVQFTSYRLIDPSDFQVENNRTKIQPGDVLLTIVGAIGRAAVVTEAAPTFTVQRSVAVLRARDILNPKFLMYQLESSRIQKFFHENARGTAQKGVYLKTLGSTDIRFPSLAEQERIVAKIEELFSELDKGVECLHLVDRKLLAYRRAILSQALSGQLTADWRLQRKANCSVADLRDLIARARNIARQEALQSWQAAVSDWQKRGQKGPKPRKPETYRAAEPILDSELWLLPPLPDSWFYARLSDVASVGSGMSVSASRKLEDPVEVPYLRVANVQRGFLDLSEMKTMQVEASQMHALLLRDGDVLFTEGGDRDKLGRGWVWQDQVKPCITQNHVFRASPYLRSLHYSKILSHWGNTFGQRYFQETGKQTVNLASINKGALSKFPVPVMPVEEAEEICNRLDELMTVADAFQAELGAAIKRVNVLRQAILGKAFSGRLVGQKSGDVPAATLLGEMNEELEDSREQEEAA